MLSATYKVPTSALAGDLSLKIAHASDVTSREKKGAFLGD